MSKNNIDTITKNSEKISDKIEEITLNSVRKVLPDFPPCRRQYKIRYMKPSDYPVCLQPPQYPLTIGFLLLNCYAPGGIITMVGGNHISYKQSNFL